MTYKEALWAWFLKRARLHGVYGGWSDLEERDARHLAECGINIAASDLPDVGEVSEFADTESPNIEREAILPEHWWCNCGKYGTGWRGDHRPSRPGFHHTLAVPGPYPLVQMIREVLEESGIEGPAQR